MSQFTYGFEDYQQNLEFQNFDSPGNFGEDYASDSFNQPNIYTQSPVPDGGFYSPNPSLFPPYTNIFTPNFSEAPPNSDFDEEEPPLLTELEIYPTRIIEKSLAVLNPFHSKGLADDAEYLFRETDLAGPIAFFLALAFFLFISDTRKDIFGYVYGLSIITVIFMYILIKLMCTTTVDTQIYISLSSVASILGYSILPIVWLSMIAVFFSLNNKFGILLASLAVFLSTSAASRIFCMMTCDKNQRFLIAYPCALVYVIFALLVLF